MEMTIDDHIINFKFVFW